MSDILDRLGSGDLFPVVIVSIVFGSILLLSVFAIVATCVYKIRRHSIVAQLKQDMLDRGMSAEEIKTVLEADVKR